MLLVSWNGKPLLELDTSRGGLASKQTVCDLLSCEGEDVYFLYNGKLLQNDTVLDTGTIHVILRVNGGKGGFGSMLRAIGAQIEKTTNREACRDLSGRRLRDINEEKRLKTFINKQVERDKESHERKIKKLEQLCEMPKHNFVDESYDKQRSDLQEKIEDAVVKGLEVADSKRINKRRLPDQDVIKKKKPKLWVDADLDECTSDECSSATDDEPGELCYKGLALMQETKVECPASTSLL